ncbi:hypothetical protein GCM10009623_15140 [Nocardioides aestuarii]
MIGPTGAARSSFGSHPVGMNRAVSRPQAMKAPTFGMTIAVRKPPKAWTRARRLGFLVDVVSFAVVLACCVTLSPFARLFRRC